MKKSILNLGKALDKAIQKQISGGTKEKPGEVCQDNCEYDLCWGYEDCKY